MANEIYEYDAAKSGISPLGLVDKVNEHGSANIELEGNLQDFVAAKVLIAF